MRFPFVTALLAFGAAFFTGPAAAQSDGYPSGYIPPDELPNPATGQFGPSAPSPFRQDYTVEIRPFSVAAPKDWRRVTSEHFTLLSRAGTRDSRALLTRFEQTRAVFLGLFAGRRVRETPCAVALFQTIAQFDPYLPLRKGEVHRLVSYSLSNRFETFFASYNGSDDVSGSSVIVDYARHLADIHLAGAPLWFRTGIPYVFKTLTASGGIGTSEHITQTLRANPWPPPDTTLILPPSRASIETGNTGNASEDFVRTLRANPWLPLDKTLPLSGDCIEIGDTNEDFVRMLRDNPWLPLEELIGARRAKSPVFRPQAWLLAHYLLCNGTGNDAALARYANTIPAPGATAARTFEEIFGMDLGTLERALKKYFDEGKYEPRRVEVPVAPIAKKIKTEPADKTDAEITLLYLRFRQRRDPGAELRLREIIAAQPGNTRAQLLLCEMLQSSESRQILGLLATSRSEAFEAARQNLIRSVNERCEEARQILGRLAAAGTDNPEVCAALAKEEFDRAGPRLGKLLEPAASARLRGLLDRAIALDPDCLDACSTLAAVEAFSVEPRVEKLGALIGAVHARRPLGRGWIGLAVMHWRAGEKEQCAALLRRLLAAPGVSKNSARLAAAVLDDCEGRVQP